ncbi:Alpha/Beta hydrolase protein [Mycena floridula]|nr:Alpha/Beta hydrolase protein [Mycena floridula]
MLNCSRRRDSPTADFSFMSEQREMFHIAHNVEGSLETVLLHGLFSSHIEFDDVVPLMEEYHLLIPDLPGHSRSSAIPLESLESVVTHVSELIKTHAHGGKAHLVGLSFGGYTALTLAATYPELVLSCFATGTTRFPNGSRLQTFALRFIVPLLVPLVRRTGEPVISYISGFSVPPALVREVTQNMGRKLASDGIRILSTEFERKPISARTLLCAGALGDSLEPLAGYLTILKRENGASDAVIVDNVDHAWDVQNPGLFARLITSWIKREESYPEGMRAVQ